MLKVLSTETDPKVKSIPAVNINCLTYLGLQPKNRFNSFGQLLHIRLSGSQEKVLVEDTLAKYHGVGLDLELSVLIRIGELMKNYNY